MRLRGGREGSVICTAFEGYRGAEVYARRLRFYTHRSCVSRCTLVEVNVHYIQGGKTVTMPTHASTEVLCGKSHIVPRYMLLGMSS
jgi:hypothetical protein